MTHDDAGSAPMLGSHGYHPNARLIVSGPPTIDEYRTALAECVAEKAADWKAACDSAEAASKEINRLRLTEEERTALNDAVYLCGATAGLANEQANATAWATCAATLRWLLERTK